MDVDKLKMVYQILKKSLVDEIIVEASNFRLRIKKSAFEKQEEAPSKKPPAVIDKSPSATSPSKVEKDSKGKHLDILSNQIGFFSRFNKKTKKQYVKLRDVVKKGDVIGNITSMHIDYEVFANNEGKIVEFLVEEGQPVEYHQPLVRLADEKEADK